MKTELLALIDELVKSELYVTEGKFSAAKDAKRIKADIVALLGQPQAPEFDFVAKLKLEGLLARGYTVSGLALEKPAADGQPERGFITVGGFVGWWRDGGGSAPAAPADALDAEIALRKVLSAVQLYLPPDGISIDVAMNEVIAAVDPWPIGRVKDES